MKAIRRKEDTMLNVKKFAIATLLAVSAGTAVLAAPPIQFDPANADLNVAVVLGSSTDTTLTLDANRLFDANELIRLNYGFAGADSLLKIKEVIAPEGITVALTDAPTVSANPTSDDSESGISVNNVVTVDLTVTSTNQNSGSYPVQVVLENSATGETTTLNLIVQAGS
jgi:hypothetical protein